MSIQALNWALSQDVRPAAVKLLLIVIATYRRRVKLGQPVGRPSRAPGDAMQVLYDRFVGRSRL